MRAEWSAECGAEDPVLVVPWNDLEGTARFVDLRENPYDLYLIPEAEQHVALQQALRALNAPRSAVFTAKCDVWALDAEEMERLRLELDIEDETAAVSGVGSYIDLLFRERAVAVSRHRMEQLLDRLVRLAANMPLEMAMLECTLRPAVVDVAETYEGYAVTLYVKAAGFDAPAAEAEWAAALLEIVKLLRGRDLAR